MDNAKRFPSPRHSLHLSWVQRNSVVLNSFDIHAGGSATRGGKEKVGRRRVRIEELEKIGSGRIYYYYYEGYRGSHVFFQKLLLEECCMRCFLQNVCEKQIILFSEKKISFFIQVMVVIYSSCGNIMKFNIKI